MPHDVMPLALSPLEIDDEIPPLEHSPPDNLSLDSPVNDNSSLDSSPSPQIKKQSALSLMKRAGRSLVGTIQRKGNKAVLAAMMMAGAALVAPHAAKAQSYTPAADAQVQNVFGYAPWIENGTSPFPPIDLYGNVTCSYNSSASLYANAEQCIQTHFGYNGNWFRTDLGVDSTGALPPSGLYSGPTVSGTTGPVEIPRCSGPYTSGSSTVIHCDLWSIPTILAPKPPSVKTLGDCGCGATPAPGNNGQPGNNGDSGAGDPITVGTGNLFEKVTDYTTAGQNPLSFTRYYNSMAGATGFVTDAVTLGTNWRSNFDRYIQTSTYYAERPDGQTLHFTTASGGGFAFDSDVDITLTQSGSGSGSTWTLKDHNDTVETYTTNAAGIGVLQSIATRNGYTQTLSYTAATDCPGGSLLCSVTDSYGRSLNFTYNSDGFLNSYNTGRPDPDLWVQRQRRQWHDAGSAKFRHLSTNQLAHKPILSLPECGFSL
jgi:hypothetical protein